MLDEQLCNDCIRGYYPPFERFCRLATQPHGPAFLNACRTCGALWCEASYSAWRITEAEAQSLFPDFRPGISQCDLDARIFADFGVEIFRRSGRLFLRFDSCRRFGERRESEISEMEALKAQKSERDAHEVVLTCRRRHSHHFHGFREAFLTVTCLDGTYKVIHMGKLVRVADGISQLRAGWSGMLTFSGETNSFVELATAPADLEDSREGVAAEVDDSYALRVYHVTRSDISR